MAKQLILTGHVQGVCCRHYCSKYARKMKIHGFATNLSRGSVRVVLDTDNDDIIREYIQYLKTNPYGFSFYGVIDEVDISDFSGRISGDYNF